MLEHHAIKFVVKAFGW